MTAGPPAGQLLVRGVVLTAPVVALLLVAGAGDPPPGWAVALVVVLALGWACLPESVLGTFTLLAVLAWWGTADLDGAPVLAVPAATLLLVAHVAAVLASYGPADLPVDRALALLWLRRTLLVGMSAPAAWVVVGALRGGAAPAGVWVAGLVAVAVGGVVLSVAFPVGGPPRDQSSAASAAS